MTREEAVNELKQQIETYRIMESNNTSPNTESLTRKIEACEIAISALDRKGEWLYFENSAPIAGGGCLTTRGYKCSSCGGFRHKRQGKSKFCEFCGAEMGGSDV